MSGENFAAGLAWIACREGDDLELSQDDRAANARKNSPGTSYVEVQKSNSNTRPRLLLAVSVHVTRRTISLTHRHRPRNILLVDNNPCPGRLPSLRLLQTLPLPVPLLLQGRQLLPHPWFSSQHRQVFPSVSHSLDQQKRHRRKISPRHCELHPHRHSNPSGVHPSLRPLQGQCRLHWSSRSSASCALIFSIVVED
ncbi:hypothetical protein PC116_g23745 [Phytophthora cactorum]|nr:hypothetical protein PC116_g23745 [Phytophthora cactorum]